MEDAALKHGSRDKNFTQEGVWESLENWEIWENWGDWEDWGNWELGVLIIAGG